MYEVEFKTERELDEILYNCRSKYILKIVYDIDRKYVVFSDFPTVEVLQKEQANKIAILEDEQVTQNEEILGSLLASTELFEMVLALVPTTINTKSKTVSNMAKVYITLIEKGVKTIDDVPLVIREEVQNNLK